MMSPVSTETRPSPEKRPERVTLPGLDAGLQGAQDEVSQRDVARADLQLGLLPCRC